MKLLTVLGTRPEIIRLSLIIPLLDTYADHTLVHTGQNYDSRLSDVFFEELGVRRPDVHLTLDGPGFGAQVGSMLPQIEKVLEEKRPDRVLILGDTNSGLAALPARRLGIPVYHMEAGNRCFDDRVPEEINRRVIDHSSSVLLPYTHRSKENLLLEGIAPNRIFVTGNPIYQVMQHYRPQIEASNIHSELDVEPGKFFLVTLHRAENVDVEARLRQFVAIMTSLATRYGFPVICSLHPRTRARLEQHGIETDAGKIRLIRPFGFPDFVRLEETAFCVLSDSGTVQEECAILGTANVTLRDVTERPETMESGSNALGGAIPDTVMSLVSLATESGFSGEAPPGYLAEHVAETVTRILLSYRLGEADA